MIEDLLLGLGQSQEGYKAIVENGSIKILSNDYKNTINKMKLSPSFVNAWLASPGDWAMGKLVVPEIQTEEPIYFARGTWFHKIMEEYYKLLPIERTFESLKQTCLRVTREDPLYSKLIEEKENKDWMNNAIKGFWKTWGEEFKNDRIAKIFLMGQQRDGLELFVSGKIGNSSRQSLGFIDRLVESEGGLKVQDWKTGKHIAEYDPNKPISTYNPFEYNRQQILYTMLLEQQGLKVKSASLIFPCSEPPREVMVDINSQKNRAQVIKDVEQVDKELTECINNDYTFPFKSGRWNSWATFLCGMGNSRKPDNIREDKLMKIVQVK